MTYPPRKCFADAALGLRVVVVSNSRCQAFGHNDEFGNGSIVLKKDFEGVAAQF
jgi:hypothetical protein